MEKINQYESGTILDHQGQPVKKKTLKEEVATTSLTGVRNVWHNQTVATGLTPDSLATLLQNAANNEPHDYLVLAEEMEERDPHYQSVLGTRKRAISGLDFQIDAATDDTSDIKLADAAREIIRTPEFGMMIEDALDAIGKGFSVNEIMWDRSGSQWFPTNYVYRDPRFFKFDPINGRELRLLDDAKNYEGIPLAPYKFITHIAKLKSGIALRGGVARLVATAYMCKAYALTDWLAFAEVFGMPLRVGKYGANATNEDINKLMTAVANIGSDAAAVIPESMRIEFESAGTTSGGDKLFKELAEWLDRQVSKAVLGQTMTSDDGSSQAQAKVHNEVRMDILKADAKQLEHTLNRDLIRPYIDLNFGKQKSYPVFKLPVPEPEDTKLLVDALTKLVPMGLQVEESQIRDKLGVADPEKDAVLLAAPSNGNAQSNPAQEQIEKAENHLGHFNSQSHCACCHATAINREQNNKTDLLDELELEGLEDWEKQMAPVIGPREKLVQESQSYEELTKKLEVLMEDMDTSELTNQLAAQLFKARGYGDATDGE